MSLSALNTSSPSAPTTPRNQTWGTRDEYIDIQNPQARNTGRQFFLSSPLPPPDHIGNWSKEVEDEFDKRLQEGKGSHFILKADLRFDYQQFLMRHKRKGNQVYRKPEWNSQLKTQLPPRYALTYSDAFDIITTTAHEVLMHFEAKKTYEKLNRDNVERIVARCRHRNMHTEQRGERGIKPIISRQPGERLTLDLMDFRADADGEYCWIWQLKDHFSKMIWVKALKGKTTTEATEPLAEWLEGNVPAQIIAVNNGG
ncbi:KRAB-A domain-containing protein 2 [Clarireedia jacksonii]